MTLSTQVYLLAIPAIIATEFLLARNLLCRNRYERWSCNVGFGCINEAIKLASPLAFSAILSQRPDNGYVLFGSMPPAVSILAAFLLLDFIYYWLHRVNHQVHLLWRFHRVHHSDLDLDFTTTFRHHPGELLVGLILIYGLMSGLGLTAAQVLPYMVAFRFVELFAHANIRLNPTLDAWLALVIVTPHVHQIHHSRYQPETDRNYGEVLTIWDRLFGTFTPATRLDEKTPRQFGLERFRSDDAQQLPAVLAQPFK